MHEDEKSLGFRNDTTVLERMVVNMQRKKDRAIAMQERHHQSGNRKTEIAWLKETERLDDLINKAQAIIKRNKAHRKEQNANGIK